VIIEILVKTHHRPRDETTKHRNTKYETRKVEILSIISTEFISILLLLLLFKIATVCLLEFSFIFHTHTHHRKFHTLREGAMEKFALLIKLFNSLECMSTLAIEIEIETDHAN